MEKARSQRIVYMVTQFLLIAMLVTLPGVASVQAGRSSGTYSNPLTIRIPGDGLVESCADPTLMHGAQTGDNYWYMYCTTDPLNSQDRQPNGDFNFHLMPMMRSLDLVNWTYMGDVFATRPGWVSPDAGLWAPEIKYFNNQYYLYYTASNTPSGSAIGVATAPTALGPWTDSGGPVVESDGRWTFDPEIVPVGNVRYIFYGSYYGGIRARLLTADGLHSIPGSQVQIAIDNRYEGSEVVQHDGYYYLFVSATDCCRGPLTGYSVFAGRSINPLGPYVDREGVSLLQGRVGGTPVISMNGNRWVGTGHNSVFQDFSGQYWTVYHAVDRFDPYFAGAVGFTKRPVLLDPLDWVGGWPMVRAGQWASDSRQAAPAAQPGQESNYRPLPPEPQVPGHQITSSSDEFNGATLSPQWSWVRQPAPGTYGMTGTTFRFDTQAADLYQDNNTASVLTEDAPNSSYIVETKMNLNVPAEGCCFNYTQGGLVIYGDDDNFIKLAHVSIWNTRQTEFAKELFPVPAGYPRYGNTVVGPPGDWTYLRIVKDKQAHEDQYTAYTSQDGTRWVRGGTWTHDLGHHERIGLVSMGGSGFISNFDYVRVYQLRH